MKRIKNIVEISQQLIKNNFKYFLILTVFLFFIRIFEFFSIEFVGEEEQNFFQLIYGFFLDLRISLLIFASAFFPQLIISIFKIEKQFIFVFLSFIYIIINFSLVIFFQKAKIPLDESIYLFKWEEIKTIANFKGNISVGIIVGLMAIFLVYFLLTKLFSKIQINSFFAKILFVIFVLNTFFFKSIFFESERKTESVFKNNRFVFFIGKSIHFFYESGESNLFKKEITQNDFNGISSDFFANNSNKFDEYSLMHSLSDTSALTPFFQVRKETPPNIVFIIVESLSSDFIGDYAKSTGNCMPFLDSLTKKSLYFPNFLSTCQRTFNLLPASLASVPNSTNGNFTTNLDFTPQMSLPLLLQESYFTRFYCGVDLNYSNMDNYISNLGTEYLVKNWQAKYKKKFSKRPNYWGYPDGYLFDKSWEDFKKQKLANKPRFDVFLTISSHDPYSFPKEEYYLAKNKKRKLSKHISPAIKKQLFENEYLMSSYSYTDDEIKKYFQKAKLNPDFKNTIFVIYGDHGCPFYARNELSKFSVPLLIYSPLLKKASKFYSISSHLDLAPTFISFLKNSYKIKFPQKVSFIGRELNMKHKFQSSRTLPFLSYNGINESILSKETILLNGKLFKISKNLNISEFKNSKAKKKLARQLKLYENFSRYCFEQKKIMPFDLFKKLTKNKVTIFNEKFQFLWSEVIDFKGKKNDAFEIDLCQPFQIKKGTKKLKIDCELECFLKTEFELDSIPRIAFSFYSKKNNVKEKIYWKIARAKFTDKFKPKSYNKLRFQLEIEVPKVLQKTNNNECKFYFFNKNYTSVLLKKVKTTAYAN